MPSERATGTGHDDDVKLLHSMGYAQELARNMRGFQNFAISFSIICILSGGINSLGQGISGVGDAAIGAGWLLGCGVSLIFALGMAQIGSAYPTAGFRTPVAAIWTAALVSIAFTLCTPAYATIVSVTVIFLFISYGLPIIAGLFAYGRSWTTMGPWNMGGAIRIVGVLTALAMALIFYLGVQPPNDAALTITLAFLALTAVVWFAFERRRFKGPPIGDEVVRRQAAIAAAERTLAAAN